MVATSFRYDGIKGPDEIKVHVNGYILIPHTWASIKTKNALDNDA